MTNGKGDKVASDFRTPQWEESKLWDQKVQCISCHKKVDPMKCTQVLENKELTFCPDCVGCYTVAEIWAMQDQLDIIKANEAQK